MSLVVQRSEGKTSRALLLHVLPLGCGDEAVVVVEASWNGTLLGLATHLLLSAVTVLAWLGRWMQMLHRRGVGIRQKPLGTELDVGVASSDLGEVNLY